MERRTSSRRGSQSQSDQRSTGLQSSFDASPDDWCNSFWDPNGAGYDAILTRLKNGSRTLDDLRGFYSARSAIEEDYAKKLAKLSRQYLGRDETGSMRMALDRVRLEVANTADAHEKLGIMFRSALESKTKEFQAQREGKKANHQGSVEKLYKAKIDQEKLALKAKEKYKNDCVSINGLTAQTSLTQGRDLDKVSAKLDKANQTVQVNKKEYEVFSHALKETNNKWTLEWKGFCDLAQDLEEERLNYMRISLWDYANGASFICVTDDESCENIRRSLEACNAPGDLRQFVHERGTGAKIYDVPAFVDYERGDHGDGRKPTFRTASFARSSAKTEIISTGQALQDLAHALKPGQQMPQTGPSQPPTPSTEQPPRGRSDSQAAQQRGRSHSRAASTHSGKEQYASPPRSATPNPDPQREQSVRTAPPSPAQQIAQAYAEEQERRGHSRQNSTISPNNDVSPLGERRQTELPAPFQPTVPLSRRQSKASLAPSRQEEQPRNRYSNGSIAASYRSTQQQQQKLEQPKDTTQSRSRKNSSASQRVPSPRAEEESLPPASAPPPAPKEEKAAEKDELAALLADLRDPNKAPERPKPFGGVKLPGMESKPQPSNRSAYNASPAPSNTSDMRRNEVQQHGYRQSYDAGRGQSPAPSQQQDFRRASSPAPSAQRMSYQAPASPAPSNRYAQQQPASPAPSNRYNGAPSSPAPVAAMMRPNQNAPPRDPAVATYGQALPGEHRMARPASQQSFHPSINEQRGRQDSQQGYAPGAGMRSPSPAPYAGTAPASYGQQGGYQYQQQPPAQQFQPPPRSTSPRPPSLHSNYGNRPVSPAPNQYAQPNHAARPVSPAPQQYSTRPVSPAPQVGYPQQYQQPGMSHAQSTQSIPAQGRPPSLYQQQQRSSTPAGMSDYANPAYNQPPQQQQNRQSAGYRHGAQVYGQQATPAQQYAQSQGYQQPQQQPYRSPSVVSMGAAQQQQSYYTQPAQAPSPQPQAQPQVQRAPSPAMQNGMSGPTTGANAGRPVLFFVRAIYDYVATVPEEFSFQEDDVIAVFATDPDGWWQGELLDENRRGGNIFPSNFCTLLE